MSGSIITLLSRECTHTDAARRTTAVTALGALGHLSGESMDLIVVCLTSGTVDRTLAAAAVRYHQIVQ